MSDPIDPFEKHWQENPEPKLELIDGRLIIGNSLAGSRFMLHDILSGWGAEAALPFAPAARWLEALAERFRRWHPPAAGAALSEWKRWANRVDYQPEIAPAGPRGDLPHRLVCERLRFDLFGIVDEPGYARSMGRDCVTRLGEDALTPDEMIAGPQRACNLLKYYLDGPADVVIEVVLPGHESQDRTAKRRRYARGGVPDYWIIDPHKRTVDLLRLIDGRYEPQPLPENGVYSPGSLPFLLFLVERLWEGDEEDQFSRRGPKLFEVRDNTAAHDLRWRDGGIAWGDRPFEPRPQLAAERLQFDEFASWCGRAKFEMVHGKPLIDGTLGTRNVLGMLLRTFGLVETVSVLTPATWIDALESAEQSARVDAARRDQWWSEVHRAAAILRERLGFGRIVAIGDLACDRPLNLWSGVTLIVWEQPQGVHASQAYDAIYDRNSDTCIHDLRLYEHATREQRLQVESTGVEV
jgi:Uma2 family endonuclease